MSKEITIEVDEDFIFKVSMVDLAEINAACDAFFENRNISKYENWHEEDFYIGARYDSYLNS